MEDVAARPFWIYTLRDQGLGGFDISHRQASAEMEHDSQDAEKISMASTQE